jgi:hypothetical protein
MKEARFKKRMLKQFLLDATICAFQERRATLPRPTTIHVEENAFDFDGNHEASLPNSPSISLKGIFAHFKKTRAVTIKHRKPVYECVPFSDGKIFGSQNNRDCPRSIIEPEEECIKPIILDKDECYPNDQPTSQDASSISMGIEIDSFEG